eukprot:740464-Prorocentrum_minimum.AAC.1
MGNSPGWMGNSPGLMGNSPVWMGNSPGWMGNSPGLMVNLQAAEEALVREEARKAREIVLEEKRVLAAKQEQEHIDAILARQALVLPRIEVSSAWLVSSTSYPRGGAHRGKLQISDRIGHIYRWHALIIAPPVTAVRVTIWGDDNTGGGTIRALARDA